MGIQKILVVKDNGSDSTETVCNESKLKGITEIAVDVHLLDNRICIGMWRQEGIGSLIRIMGIIKMMSILKSFGCPMMLFIYLVFSAT